MFGFRKKERVPVFKPGECLGSSCEFYTGSDCDARLELLEAGGKSGGKDKGPYVHDSRYAVYGKVCMGGEEQIVNGFSVESPNGNASLAEAVAISGLYENRRIVLNTPSHDIKF